jgi:hypothetical protein
VCCQYLAFVLSLDIAVYLRAPAPENNYHSTMPSCYGIVCFNTRGLNGSTRPESTIVALEYRSTAYDMDHSLQAETRRSILAQRLFTKGERWALNNGLMASWE